MIENWRIWNNDSKVEQKTYLRTKGELPEMESTKQLVEILKEIYKAGDKIADVGCASGHYYKGIKRLGSNVSYTGIDATEDYIKFAKEYYENNENTSFYSGDIFDLDKKFSNEFDIVYCCNVILHLPDFKRPIENLLKISKKYVLVRSLFSPRTHLSKYLYSDTFDENGQPSDFVFQNTYSYPLVENFVKSLGDFKVSFLDDKFETDQINSEYSEFKKELEAGTKIFDDVQISGSKVFEWKWLLIEKN